MTDVPMRNVGFTTTQWNTFNGRHNLNIGVRFRAQTCAVAARDVVLDPIDIMDLHTQGSGGEMPFEMAVTCAAAGRPLSLEMLDANDPNNVNSWLVPAAGSSTTGVALQLMHNGAPLQLHQQWVQGSTGTGTVQVPFSARYLRTSDPLAPGAILASHDQSEEETEISHRMNLLGRKTGPDEVAEATLFLAQGHLASGQTLYVDSGQHLLAQPRDVIYLAREEQPA